MKEVIDKHYKNLADKYDNYLYYSPRFVRTLSSKMVEKLSLKPEDDFVDLGGGTGMFSLDIHEQVPLERASFCVDPFQEMLDKIPDTNGKLKPLCMDAVVFSRQNLNYNKVLIKEAVHHIAEREELFANIYKRLPSGGRMLLVHVPPDIKYPIFEKALERTKGWHACPKELTRQLTGAGFRVEADFVAYPHKIPKDKYFEQVRERFMSVLTSFSDEEIEEGLKEMDQKYGHDDVLEFIDHFDYLTAIKE